MDLKDSFYEATSYLRIVKNHFNNTVYGVKKDDTPAVTLEVKPANASTVDLPLITPLSKDEKKKNN